MTTATLQQIGDILNEMGTPNTFSAKRTRPIEDLHLEVRGLGRIQLPVAPEQAEQLCEIGRPARYGQGEKTLLNRSVRDTWEIPKGRVKIDQRQWKKTLEPMLEQLAIDLGVPTGGRLKAELHAMLVYAPGQFFLPHQDSEKADGMVGTLVVTLPSSFKGGTLVVDHQGESTTCRGSKKLLSFVAFYADCRHEVRPVKEGYRVSLTYNLMLECEGSTGLGTLTATPEVIDALAVQLREHFETPIPPRWSWQKDAIPEPPPLRLVYLLDHQYTERGLGWQKLKGNDAPRVAALAAAAEGYDCESVLALSEIHEAWSCMESDRYSYGRHRYWERDEEDEWHESVRTDDPDTYELIELFDGSITLTHWLDPSGKKATPIATFVGDEEVCASTPSKELEAYASEYEGYTGNAGNTMDRWYRRAALVLWPRKHTFAVRGEASPTWAVAMLQRLLRSGAKEEAQDKACSLLGFWDSTAPREEDRSFFEQTLEVAERVTAPELATALLKPFRLEALSHGHAALLVALAQRYREEWIRTLVEEWTSQRRINVQGTLAWLDSLPRLCAALCEDEGGLGRRCAELLWDNRWAWFQKEVTETLALASPTRQDRAVRELATPLFGLLESVEIIGALTQRDEVVLFLCAEENRPLIPGLVQMLRVAAERSAAKKRGDFPSFEAIRIYCIEKLEECLAPPPRAADDWAIEAPGDCRCDLCSTLSEFLVDPTEQQLEWPLAKPKRQHIHRQIDAHELPVRHVTRRAGRPHTLVLTKMEELFEREASKRRSWRDDLEWFNA